MSFLDPWTAGSLVVVLLFLALAAGVHIGVALGTAGLLGLYLAAGERAALGQLSTIPYRITSQYALAVIPQFILMGSAAGQAGITTELYQAAFNWLSRLRGGLAMATVAGCALFGGVSGSSVVDAAVFTRIALPEMVRHGYDKRLAAGCIAASGTLASIIPPSVSIVIYGIVTGTSIGKVLIAGVVPGVFSALVFMVGIYLLALRNPTLAPLPTLRISWRTRFQSLWAVWGMLSLFLLVMGGIYSGLVTPTSAGALGACGAFVLAIAKRRLNGSSLVAILRETGVTASAVFIIVVGGTLFARFLTFAGIVDRLSDFLTSLAAPRFVYLLAYIVLWTILGCFIDPISIMVLTLPLMFPIMTGVGYDPIWLGIITIKLGEIAMITPPVGLNVYVVKSASPIPMTLEDVFVGTLPFLVLDFIILALLIAFPQIVLVLPDLMR